MTLEELEQRVAAIEQQLQMESGLRASGDRDLADMAQTLRAQQHTIQALAITQSQHNEKLDALQQIQLGHYAEHKTDAAEIKAGIAHIVTLLEGLGGERP